MPSVPTLSLDSATLPPGTALATYQATLPYYKLGLTPGVTLESFTFRATAWMLEDLILARLNSQGLTVSRTPEHIRADSTDNYCFFAFTSGNWAGDIGGRPVTVGAGQIVGFDFAKPFEAQSTDHSALSLVVARTSLSKQFRSVPNLHGHVFEGAGAELLLDHMLSLERRAPTMQESDIAPVVKATIGMISAVLTTIPSRPEIDAGVLAFQHEVRRFIENHLHELDLTLDRIVREMAIARSTLFRAFKPLGGVAAYVQRRRLEVIRSLLLSPDETRSIVDLAYTFGFTSQSHFAVAFKKAFGRSAREMRSLKGQAAALGGGAENSEIGSAYREWRRRLLLR